MSYITLATDLLPDKNMGSKADAATLSSYYTFTGYTQGTRNAVESSINHSDKGVYLETAHHIVGVTVLHADKPCS